MKETSGGTSWTMDDEALRSLILIYWVGKPTNDGS